MHFCYFSTPGASTHFCRARPIRCKYGWRNLRLILYVHKKVIESFKWVLKSCKNGTFWLGIKTFLLASFDFKFFTKVHFYKILKMREICMYIKSSFSQHQKREPLENCIKPSIFVFHFATNIFGIKIFYYLANKLGTNFKWVVVKL